VTKKRVAEALTRIGAGDVAAAREALAGVTKGFVAVYATNASPAVVSGLKLVENYALAG